MDHFRQTTTELSNFILRSPSCFHAIENSACLLEEAGFTRLSEGERWELAPGGSYYVIRGGSSLIAFRIPEDKPYNYQIIASHSDSPSFKVKESPEIEKLGCYVELNVEKYGSPLLAPWFDRPLGVAGRLVAEDNGSLRTVLADSGRALVMIPDLAIHMNRNANDNMSYKIQTDMLPLFGEGTANGRFKEIMAQSADVDPEMIFGSDLFLYDRSDHAFWGADEEFFSAPKLDNLQNAFSSVIALLSEGNCSDCGKKGDNSLMAERPVRVCCIFDNEEVGSRTKQGADSTFLESVLERIGSGLSLTDEEKMIMISRSFMLSADNAHAAHPNHPEKADPVNQPKLNGGVVIKHSANQKYTTDAVSAAVFRFICKDAGIPIQEFTNHSDNPGGSTLGNISSSHVSVPCVDIGCPQLAMHSPYETTGTKDTWYMTEAMKAFYNTSIIRKSDGTFELQRY